LEGELRYIHISRQMETGNYFIYGIRWIGRLLFHDALGRVGILYGIRYLALCFILLLLCYVVAFKFACPGRSLTSRTS